MSQSREEWHRLANVVRDLERGGELSAALAKLDEFLARSTDQSIRAEVRDYRRAIELDHLERRVTRRAWDEGDYPEALREIEAYVGSAQDMELRARALSISALLREETGDLEGARRALLDAMSFLKQPSFARQAIELGLGAISERLGDVHEAKCWYMRYLDTYLRSAEGLAGAALQALGNLGFEGLTESEYEICVTATQRSWKTLGLAGEPDVSNLGATAQRIIKAEGEPGRRQRLQGAKE